MHVVHSLCVYKNCMHFVQPHITYQTHQKTFLSSFASRMVLDLRMQRRIRKRSQHLPPTPILPQRNILLHLPFSRLPPSIRRFSRHRIPFAAVHHEKHRDSRLSVTLVNFQYLACGHLHTNSIGDATRAYDLFDGISSQYLIERAYGSGRNTAIIVTAATVIDVVLLFFRRNDNVQLVPATQLYLSRSFYRRSIATPTTIAWFCKHVHFRSSTELERAIDSAV
mmetsp:Transcript_40179/g.84116  ORF Transcript_40179/g.84116 Transcript_40179/m.84116 type:complete len:223 (-) Transcript_40179:1075-1743(-)